METMPIIGEDWAPLVPSDKMGVLFEGCDLTEEWFLDTMEKACNHRPHIVKVEPLGVEAVGYMSVMRKIALRWDCDSPSLPKSVVIKKPSPKGLLDSASNFENGKDEAPVEDEKAKAAEAFVAQLQQLTHDAECKTYTYLMKDRPIPIPTIYCALDSTTSTPVIIMEDLSHCKVEKLMPGLTDEQVYTILDEIIALHVYSLTTSEWREHVKSMDLGTGEFRVGFANMFTGPVGKLAELRPDLFSQASDALNRNCYGKSHDWVNLISPRNEYHVDVNMHEKPSVICHGDCWSSQILWDGDRIGAIVDWQVSHAGPVTEDLLRLLCTSIPAADRKRLTQPLLDYYYHRLTVEMRKLGATVPFTKETLMAEYKSALPYSCAFNAFCVGVWIGSGAYRCASKSDEECVECGLLRCLSFMQETVDAYGWQ